MADTSTVTIDLDVIEKYNALVKESIGGDSVYIRAKETLESFLQDSEMTEVEKANTLSDMLGNMVTGLTNQSMNTALAMAKDDREAPYMLTKIKADSMMIDEQRDKVAAEVKKPEFLGTKVFKEYSLQFIDQSSL